MDSANHKKTSWTRTGLIVLAAACAIAGLRAHDLKRTAELQKPRYQTVRPRRSTFVRSVPAGGEVRNYRPIVVHSDVRAWDWPEIIEMVPPGAFVKKGDPVIVLDAAPFRRRINKPTLAVIADNARLAKAEADEVIQKHRNSRRTSGSQFAAKMTGHRLRAYEEGDSEKQAAQLVRTMKMRQQSLMQSRESLEDTQRLARVGIVSSNTLVAAERRLEKSEVQYDLAEGQFALFQDFNHPRRMTELEMAQADASLLLDITQQQNRLESAIAKAWSASFRKYRAGWQSHVDYLQRCIDACIVRAPKDGQVIYINEDDKMMEIGRKVHYMQKLFSVADRDRLSVAANISDRFFFSLRHGQRATVRLPALENKEFQGSVTWMGPIPTKMDKFSPDSLIHKIEILIDGSGDDLKELYPGMTAKVDIIVDVRSDVLQVPIGAVIEHRGEHVVLEQHGDNVLRRVVDVGSTNEDFAHISSGVDSETDLIVGLPEELRNIADSLD
ncbi:MAG: efflux RND transporter periplasmic adaptor subunit [Planctomycetaceae bacterium]